MMPANADSLNHNPEDGAAAAAYPRISIVTPSFNQGRFLEAAIRSVLDQNYPNLEYVVIDGGSTDGSAEIIRRYADRLNYWVSEPDGGQYAAINKGFARTTGAIMAWLNSDDMYLPWAFETVARFFTAYPDTEWVTTAFPIMLDSHGRPVDCSARVFTRQGVLRGEYLPCAPWDGYSCVQQESTFWTRRLWDRTGQRVAAELRYAGDFELWTRFALHAELRNIPMPLAGFRLHDEQKTHGGLPQYFQEAESVLRRLGVRPPWLRHYVKGAGRRLARWAKAKGLIKRTPPPTLMPQKKSA
jgi:hypothetical protein